MPQLLPLRRDDQQQAGGQLPLLLPFIVRPQQNTGHLGQTSAARWPLGLFKLLAGRRANVCALVLCLLVASLLYVQLFKFPSQLQQLDQAAGAARSQHLLRHQLPPLGNSSSSALSSAVDFGQGRAKEKEGGMADERRKVTPPKFKGPRNDRQRAVQRAFQHAWRAYKQWAWGHDHLMPLSKSHSEFLELGLTIVDSLDTLLLMGLREEFEEAREWVRNGLDLSKNRFVNLFETTIRVLGGLLSAYHLSGDPLFLEKAEDIGRRLLPAIASSPTAIPFSDVNLATGFKRQPSWSVDSSLAEVASLQLEFRELSRLTGNPEYERLAFRISEHIHSQPCAQRSGLCGMYIGPNDGTFREPSTITFGARADSYYEYLFKQWLQTGKTIQWLADDYRRAMKTTFEQLWKASEANQLYFVGELLSDGKFSPKMDHLVCFLAGTLALGSQHGMPAFHLEMAKNLSATCHAIYDNPTGLGPEIAWFNIPGGDTARRNGAPAEEENLRRKMPDFYVKALDAHSLLRPEAIEAWFYMWRVTGDKTYQEWGWAAFQAIERHARISSGGYSSVQSVKKVPVQHRDMMESFFLAETLKYLYLLFSDERPAGDDAGEEELPLDKWVFNTEAHPLPIRTN